MSTGSSLSSSPARSSSSTMAIIGGNVGPSSSTAVDDLNYPTDQLSFQDRKAEALQGLRVSRKSASSLRLGSLLQKRFTMELHDLVARCLAMIITVLLIARISSCLDTAGLSEVNAPFYVAKSYFNKHDNLVDSKFEDFIAHDILPGACVSLQGNVEFSPQLSALHGKLIGEGSHRRLSSTLRLKMTSESISRPPNSCEVIIVERLPSGVFADPFELQHLVQRGVFRDAAVFGDTNLELPSFLSNRSLVEVHLEVGTNLTSQQKDELEIHVELPLHARYQPLGHGFSRVEFASPDLFLRCNVERKEHDTSCLFLLDKQSSELIDTHAVWEVPCGNREHTEVVSAFTFISAVVSALLIIVASIRYSDNTASNVLKQS